MIILQQVLGDTIERRVLKKAAGDVRTLTCGEQEVARNGQVVPGRDASHDVHQYLQGWFVAWRQPQTSKCASDRRGEATHKRRGQPQAVSSNAGYESRLQLFSPWLIIVSLTDLAANMIGRSNARRGARRIFAVLQNRRLNQHLVYTIVDEVR